MKTRNNGLCYLCNSPLPRLGYDGVEKGRKRTRYYSYYYDCKKLYGIELCATDAEEMLMFKNNLEWQIKWVIERITKIISFRNYNKCWDWPE